MLRPTTASPREENPAGGEGRARIVTAGGGRGMGPAR
jgi:hypothetical protein